jgi:acyl-CoA thioesterase-1
MTEMAPPLRWAMFHFGSGDALFLGCFLLFLATRAEAWHWQRRWVHWCGWFGIAWIGLSSWPALVIQALLLTGAIVWLLRDLWPKHRRSESWTACRRVLISGLLIAVVVEWTWHRPLRLNLSTAPQIAVIGDSVTAGLERNDFTWPQQAARRFGWTVFDASQQGATVTSALRQFDALGGRGDMLIVEIGGNDVLEGRPLDEFARDLNALLRSACASYDTVVMCELPLPPFANRYGELQRRLASRRHVRLIPKREFIAALASPGGTVDGVHLSDAGQTRLAEMFGRALGGRSSPTPGEYLRCEPPQSRSPL